MKLKIIFRTALEDKIKCEALMPRFLYLTGQVPSPLVAQQLGTNQEAVWLICLVYGYFCKVVVWVARGERERRGRGSPEQSLASVCRG